MKAEAIHPRRDTVILKLTNTLTRGKPTEFKPIDATNVRMYVCGPTVYDLAHIGNARPVIVFDVLFRLLRHIYGENHVRYVRNITDVDDKINARAAERYPNLAPELGIRKLTEETAAQFHKDIEKLNVLPPTKEPRATEHIAEMVALCDQLIKNGNAYVAADHVLFDVASMPDYGRLSNRSLDEMEAGARVEVAPYKKGPMDFVLWKPSKAGEPAWASPAGIAVKGRPGWHIECSAMAGKHLGETFDIHGGGIDLTFPHHENEIAQSRCAHRTPVMANVWMHNGFLQVEGEKMSKSLGNFITINELLETEKFGGRRWPGEVLRLAMLMTHYRQPIDWTVSRLQEAYSRRIGWLGPPPLRGLPEKGKVNAAVVESLSDDLNTIAAFGILDELARRSRDADEPHPADKSNELAATLRWLGLASDADFDEARADSEHLRSTIRAASIGISVDTVNELIAARLDARKRKDFKESDRIRDELAEMGVVLKDMKNKDTGEIETAWEIKR